MLTRFLGWFKSFKENLKKEKSLLFSLLVVFLLASFIRVFFYPPQTQAGILEDVYSNLLKGLNLLEKAKNQEKLNVGGDVNSDFSPSQSNSSFNSESQALSDWEQMVVTAVEKASPAVVSIVITKDLPVIEQCPYNPFSDLPEEFQQFFGGGFFQFYQPCQKGTQKKEVGGGTGFFVSSDGLIVTNKHVVSDTKAEYTVLTNDGKKYQAKILDRHPSLDLALLKISGSNFPTLKLGDSSKIKLGQTAISIGNALGEFRNTVSVGVISGLARNVVASDKLGQTEVIENVIQTDAAINPGNSGGPLLNSRGEVIGINVAMVSEAQNIGFAIPINAAKKSIESVRASGKIKTAFLGVRYILLNSEIAKKYNLSVEEGALLKGGEDGFAVEPGSPAEKAGLREGDVILEIDGQKISLQNSPAYLISQKNPGDTISLKILRQGKELELKVTLGERK